MNMKQSWFDSDCVCSKTEQQASPPLPPPPPKMPRLRVQRMAAGSITNKEIAKFWRRKQIKEEEHLLAAIKAAARIRARNLSLEDYMRFEESLKHEDDETECYEKENGEIRVGIKDWWTKSKYAYLNQPALSSTKPPKKRASSYAPNCFSFKPSAPLYPTSLGVF